MEYFDQNNNIRSELLDQKAYDQAKKFIKYLSGTNVSKGPKDSLSSAQLRRFFNEFRQLEKKVTTDGFDRVKPLIKMTKSKAAYASNPNNPKIPETFKNFLVEHVDSILTERDFEAFMLHFEAVVGFYYGIENTPK